MWMLVNYLNIVFFLICQANDFELKAEFLPSHAKNFQYERVDGR